MACSQCIASGPLSASWIVFGGVGASCRVYCGSGGGCGSSLVPTMYSYCTLPVLLINGATEACGVHLYLAARTVGLLLVPSSLVGAGIPSLAMSAGMRSSSSLSDPSSAVIDVIVVGGSPLTEYGTAPSTSCAPGQCSCAINTLLAVTTALSDGGCGGGVSTPRSCATVVGASSFVGVGGGDGIRSSR